VDFHCLTCPLIFASLGELYAHLKRRNHRLNPEILREAMEDLEEQVNTPRADWTTEVQTQWTPQQVMSLWRINLMRGLLIRFKKTH
jgi:hypothetical protein